MRSVQAKPSELIATGVKDNLPKSYKKSHSNCQTGPEMLLQWSPPYWHIHTTWCIKIGHVYICTWILRSTSTCPQCSVYYLTVVRLSLMPSCMLDLVPTMPVKHTHTPRKWTGWEKVKETIMSPQTCIADESLRLTQTEWCALDGGLKMTLFSHHSLLLRITNEVTLTDISRKTYSIWFSSHRMG